MKNKYFILFVCFIIFLIVVCVSIGIFSNTNNDNTKDKVQEELNYMEVKLLGMLNSLNNIPFSNSILLEQNTIKGQENSEDSSSSSFNSSKSSEKQTEESSSSSSEGSSDSSESKSTNYTKYNVESQNILTLKENDIDWDYLKNTVEVLHSSWPTIMIDLHSINIKNDDIFNFSNNLDTLIVNIENEDKRSTINNLAILYSLIPTYLEQFLKDTDKINISYTKSCIINSYALLEDEKWDDMQNQITKAGEYFGIIINSLSQDRSQSTISKTYVLLNEIKNTINLKDKKLYYMKYKNLMESAMNI